MADDPPKVSPVEYRRWQRATETASVVALVLFLGAMLLLGANVSTEAQSPVAATESTVTTETVAPDAPQSVVVEATPAPSGSVSTSRTTTTAASGVTSTSVTKVTTPAPDTSLIGQFTANGGTPWILALLSALLVAFIGGAVTQRVLVGRYGFSLGPITVPDVAMPVEALTLQAKGLLADDDAPSPLVRVSSGPQILWAQNYSLLANQPTVPFVMLSPRETVLLARDDLLTALQTAVPQANPSASAPRAALLGLVASGSINASTARAGLLLLEVADRVESGEPVSDRTAQSIAEQLAVVTARVSP